MESEQTAELAAALAKAQSVMGPAIINRVNPHFKNRYADLAAVFEAVRKPLADNSLAITQTTEMRDGAFLLVTKLRHATGQWIASEYPLPLNAKPQELGSALTYARRYSLSALTGIAADEDDDGEATRKANGNGRHIGDPTGEVLSEEQCQTLIAAIEAGGMSPTAWLKGARAYFQIDAKRMGDIPAVLYTACLDKIQHQVEPEK
jgi:hypothetical protein